MTVQESEYRYLIRRAVREGNHALAQQLREWGFEKHDFDLLDYCKHPSTHESPPQLRVVGEVR